MRAMSRRIFLLLDYLTQSFFVLDCILKDFLYICNVKTNPPLYDEYLGQLLKGNLKIPFG